MIKKCEVCVENTSNYKCPKCYILFCSVACGARHKDSENCSPQTKTDQPHPLPADNENEFTTEHTVPPEKLSQLRDSSRLREILKNAALREMLSALDSSSTPEETLKEAMKDPEFEEFVNVCLNVVDPEQPSQS